MKRNSRRSLSFNKSASINRLGLVSAFSFAALLFATVCPLYNVSGTESAEAAVGTSQDSTITFTATRTTASASLGTISNSGSFATSNEEQKASFSIATNNYTGYELKIKSSADDALTNASVANNPAIISPISDTEGITSDEFANNTWGFLPSYYNSTENSEDKYYPITTSDVTLRKTSSANTNDVPDIYTIGLGIKADYDAPAGTYTNDSLVLTYVANPVTYAITYDKGNTTDTVSNLPYFQNDSENHTQSGSISSSSVTLSSTTPTRTGYDFTGWCLGSISTNTTTKVDSCVNDTANGITAKTFQPGGAFGIDQTTTNIATIHAMWTGKATVTLSRNTGASAIVIDGTSYTSSSVSLAYGTHTISGSYNSGYEFSSWAVSSGVTFASGTSSSTATGSITITGNGTLTLNGKQSCTAVSGTMQDFIPTSDTCTTGTLTDSRDSKSYTVAKLADGKWWMTSNLNLAGGTVLSSDKSNVPRSNYYTLPASTTISSGTNVQSGQFSNKSTAYVFNTGNNTNNCASDTPCNSYYSWLAATAGGKDSSGNAVTTSGYNAAYSICPKGWRLPAVTTSNASPKTSPNWKTGDWYALATSYGASLENNYYDQTSATGANFYTNAGPGTTPNFLIAGNYYSGSFHSGGSYGGYYWSSTVEDSLNAYYMRFTSSGVYPASGGEARSYGYNVRCVFDDRGIADAPITTLQQVTANIAENTAIGDTATLKDSRDNKSYTVAKLADGKIWMTSNLNLAGGTVLSSDKSNVPSSNYYTLPTSTTISSGTSVPSGQFSSDSTAYVFNTGNNTNNCTSSAPCNSYYSWLAATAGGKNSSGNAVTTDGYNAAYSICPKGWRLPTSTTSNASAQTSPNWKTGDWYALATAYGANLESNYYEYAATFYTNAGPGTTPNFLRAGYYNSGSFGSGGSGGYYWSSTARSSTNAYYMSFSSSGVNSANNSNRRNGYSVRCVFGV